eukprot:5281883-Pleurochrysis_carterae.AAC.3
MPLSTCIASHPATFLALHLCNVPLFPRSCAGPPHLAIAGSAECACALAPQEAANHDSRQHRMTLEKRTATATFILNREGPQ